MNVVERAKNMLLTPAKEWDVVKSESLSIADMFTKYAMILAAIPAICGMIGFSLIGYSTPIGSFRIPFGRGLTWMIFTYILNLAGVYLFAFIADALAPNFGSTKDMTASVKVAVFSYTASWVAGILLFIPGLGTIVMVIGGIYSLYLAYLGLGKIKTPPQDKLMGYFFVLIIALIVISFLIGFLAQQIVFGGSMRMF